jgi:DNA-binding NtrC family response regulator
MGDLEKVIDDKIKPVIEISTSKAIGKPLNKLNEDITSRLKSNLFFDIDFEKPFKEAKREFKQKFLKSMIMKNCGNVSEVARIVELDRRSIHRLVDDEEIKEIREKMPKMYDVKFSEISHMLDVIIDTYRSEINSDKIKSVYAQVPKMADFILKEIPDETLTLKEAEEEFEKEYLKKAIERFKGDFLMLSKEIGIRHETLSRKIRNLGLI